LWSLLKQAKKQNPSQSPFTTTHSFGLRVMSGEKHHALTEDDFIECERLHPARRRAVRPMPKDDTAQVIVQLGDLKKIIRKTANGTQPGPSGVTGEMLLTFMNDDRCQSGLLAMVQSIVDGWFGKNEFARAILLASRLVLIPKFAADGKTKKGVRPIAMGESLWKVAVSCAKEKVPTLFTEIQYGVQFSGGCDVSVIGVQAALEECDDHIAVMFDVSNAFNERERDDIADALYSRSDCKSLWRLFDFAYAGSPTPLLVYGEKGELKHVQPSANGVRQGDPLAALLFALSMQQVYEDTRKAGTVGGGTPKCFAILDDFTIVGTPEMVLRAMDRFIILCEKHNIKINAEKTAILCPQGAGQIKTLTEQKIAELNVNYRTQFMVSNQRFAPLLGSVVGRDEEGMKQWAIERVEKHRKFFELLPLLHAHVASLCLRWAGVPRVNNLLRTLPPQISMPAAELFDVLVMDAFDAINKKVVGHLNGYSRRRVRLPVKKSGSGYRSAANIAESAYLKMVARTANAGLISEAMVQRYYDSKGGGGPPDGGGGDGGGINDGSSSVDSDTSSYRRPMKRQRLIAPHSSASSSSSSSSSSSVSVAGAVNALTAYRSMVRAVEECIESVHDKVKDDESRKKEVNEIIPKGRGFWSKFNAQNQSSIASTLTACRSSASAAASLPSASSSSASVMSAVAGSGVESAVAKAISKMQSKLTALIEEAEFDRLLKEMAAKGMTKDAVLMANCAATGAAIVHNVKPMDRSSRINDSHHWANIRHQYGAPPLVANDCAWRCACGELVSAGHNHVCKKVMGPATLQRHESVVDTLAEILKQDGGFAVERVPRKYYRGATEDDRERLLIPDLVISRHDVHEAIDVSCVYGESDSYLPKGSIADKSASELRSYAGGVIEKREKHKEVHYGFLEKYHGIKVTPFVFESHGALGRSAEDFIDRIATIVADGDETKMGFAGYIRRRIAIAIHRGNALLDERAQRMQRNSFGALVSLGLSNSSVAA
jgi:hypothetical protein